MKAILNELWDRMGRAADPGVLYSHALVDAAARASLCAVPRLDEIVAARQLLEGITFGK